MIVELLVILWFNYYYYYVFILVFSFLILHLLDAIPITWALP